jgi:hypothetical protein
MATAVGRSTPFPRRSLSFAWPSGVLVPFSPSALLAVGNDPYPVPSVRGVDGASWNNKRLHFVTFSFQVRNTLIEPHADEPINILTNTPMGLCLRYNPEHFRPERTVILLAFSLPGIGKGLTRKSSGENKRPLSCPVKCLDVVMYRHSWEVFL